jgi:hypothetical protein
MGVLEVDDVRPVGEEEVRQVLGVERLVAGGEGEEVEVVGLGEDEVLAGVAVDRAEGGSRVGDPIRASSTGSTSVVSRIAS